ncbi:glycoside hydrolase family 99-like domain-containing protein [Marinobacter sp.]|uniref:glycoside hydrolase family 99-like domain-containing protein n=1 Tax=Marinobacter sp. TaxID=50741 RepID=UPI003A9554A2
MVKLLAFYLPQFHPIKENDAWWGEGFTEWHNVTGAAPRFKGHYQPHLPSDLGFYDLRVAETRNRQADLAKAYGIDGFCYYHYWFNGHQLLERPLKEVLKEKQPDFPFCICWANENWTRAWDGLENEVLISQDYTKDDCLNHIRALAEYFEDDRYVKINEKPLFIVYRPDNIPDPRSYFEIWRNYALDVGLKGVHICAVKSGFSKYSEEELISLGFDSVLDFQPNREDFPKKSTRSQAVVDFARKTLPSKIFQYVKRNISMVNVIDYKSMVFYKISKPWPGNFTKFPCVFPSWDNSARRRSPTIIQNLDPKLYASWLEKSIANVKAYTTEEQIVFINAWNEWAEGCHLEPDRKNNRAFLEITKKIKESSEVEK